MRQRTRSLACKNKKARKQVTTVTPETPGIPRAMVLTVSFVVSPETGFLSPSSARCGSIVANLVPASGYQDATTSPSADQSALVLSAIGVHRIPPHVRDDREAPLHGRDGRS